jgi:glycosyltransferase involved in cell wall biosynthesis
MPRISSSSYGWSNQLAELVVFSHLRWVFVWQRPQHIVWRLGRRAETFFIEEPLAGTGVAEPTLRSETHGPVTRVWLEVPGPERHVDFGDPAAATYDAKLQELLGETQGCLAWLYTPLALPLTSALGPRAIVYDVMDDLASFSGAPAELRFRHQQALQEADIVFAGGRSLHASVTRHRPDAHLFPSGVEPEHYAVVRPKRAAGARPVAGYVGVVDERLDLALLEGLAERLPSWEIRVVGPVVKIDPGTLPQRPNLVYTGPEPYARLPEVMAGFDVALMPFALNEATRSISPTKTLEYFAAGLPVVSTRVPDVVTDYGQVVSLADDPEGFAAACERARKEPVERRLEQLAPVLDRQRWDAIAERMQALLPMTAVPASRVEAGGLG